MGRIFYPKYTYIDPQHIDLMVMALAALIIKVNEDLRENLMRFKMK